MAFKKRIMFHETPDGKLSKVVVDKEKTGSLTKDDACLGLIYDCEFFKNKACSKFNTTPYNLFDHKTDRNKFGCPDHRWWYAGPTEEAVKKQQTGIGLSGEQLFEIQEGMSLIIIGPGKSKPATDQRVAKTNKKVYTTITESHEALPETQKSQKEKCGECHFHGWLQSRHVCRHPTHPEILSDFKKACKEFQGMFEKVTSLEKVGNEAFTQT